MSHVWYWRSRLGERKGQPCEVLARGRMGSILVRFADGQTSDRVTGEIDLEQLPCALTAQIRERRALHNSKLPLR